MYLWMEKHMNKLKFQLKNLEWEKNFLKESDTATIRKFEGEVLGVQLPDKVTLQITEAEQAVKGDTATGATKNAVLETGFPMISFVPLRALLVAES